MLIIFKSWRFRISYFTFICHEDKLLLGLDKMKSRNVIIPDYNDKQWFTRDFNLNLLNRVNTEFDADFVVDKFEHVPNYFEEA